MALRTGFAGICCAAATVILAAACSASSPSSSPSKKVVHHGHDASVAKSYTSITEMRRDSTAVVQGTVGKVSRTEKADQAGTSNIRALVTSFHVSKVLSGSVAQQSTILLHQVVDSNSGNPIDGALKRQQTYVLFVTPFTFGAGTKATHEWVIVGGQGAYELQGAQLTRTSLTSSGLPATISMRTLTSQAR